MCLWNTANGEKQDPLGSVFVQKSGHVDDDVQISALHPSYEMAERKSRYIGEVLDCCRREDSSDFERSELNELVGNLTCPDACEGKVWKSVRKIVTDEKINPKILMDEKSLKTWKE